MIRRTNTKDYGNIFHTEFYLKFSNKTVILKKNNLELAAINLSFIRSYSCYMIT